MKSNLPKEARVHIDTRFISVSNYLTLLKEMKSAGLTLVCDDNSLVDEVWGASKPALSDSRVWVQDQKYAGMSTAHKY